MYTINNMRSHVSYEEVTSLYCMTIQRHSSLDGYDTSTRFTTHWSFPVLIATEKDGKPCFYVAYCALNQRMNADRWLIPKIQEIFDYLGGGNFFSILDRYSKYWQIRVSKSCKEKTIFFCSFGTLQFEVISFCLMNAPSTFQRIMDQISLT